MVKVSSSLIHHMLMSERVQHETHGAAQSAEHSGPVQRARVRGSPGGTPTCTLMTPGACKIRHEYNVFHIPIQIKLLGIPKLGRHPLRDGSKL